MNAPTRPHQVAPAADAAPAAETGSKRMTMIQALRSAMDVMLARDPNVVVFGEDVGYFGGVFRATAGLQQKHGVTRVFDTPICEAGKEAEALGTLQHGPLPPVESMFEDVYKDMPPHLKDQLAQLEAEHHGH